ncbi:MAG: hypothetical protein CFK49_11240 [Armatimonadetes bacterium JP3_11]|jgi:hypothetical protein|nr:MAG: hypothetical protein CFK49_11240 [Armatimonadetes bacterium JP3_11]RMH07498.1 MAG: hypothetical protein D6697_08390 [Armatimonadota bacterium]
MRVWVGALLLLITSQIIGQPLQVYTHPKKGFRIATPGTWKPDTSNPDLLVEFITPDDTSFYLSVAYEPVPFATPSRFLYNTAIDNFLREFRKVLAQELKIKPEQIVEIGRNIHKVGTLSVATLDVRAPTRDDWVFRARVRLVIADQGLYAISFTGDEEEFQQNEALVNQILDSFQPKNPQHPPFSTRALWMALGAACISGVLFTGLILLLVRKLSR